MLIFKVLTFFSIVPEVLYMLKVDVLATYLEGYFLWNISSRRANVSRPFCDRVFLRHGVKA